MLTSTLAVASGDRGIHGWLKNLFARLRQLVRDWRHGGITRVGKRLSRFVQMPGVINLIVLGCVDPMPLNIETNNLPTGYVFSRANSEEVDEIAECSGGDPEARARLTALFRQFFAQGHYCVVARAQNRIVGHLWAFSHEYTITTDDYRSTRLPVILDATSIFTGNAYVAPAHRNQEIFRHLKLYLMRQYPPGTRFYAWVDELNDASLAANRALGFKPLAELRFAGSAKNPRVELRSGNVNTWAIMHQPGARLRISGAQVSGDEQSPSSTRHIS